MSLLPEQITIAVTVYSRREHLKQSIGSALGQTIPVRVMVVEDCGPDPNLESYVRQEFGSALEYRRSARRRGIFGNWNACIEQCQTPWLSILHDDDYLQPDFVARMLELNRLAGERGLYYGRTTVIDSAGNPRPEWNKPPLPAPWMPVTLEQVLLTSPFSFPGQLFQVALAKRFGGFRETSLFCGEWELWSKIIALHGGAQTDSTVAVFRDHGGWDRGTSRIYRSGKTHALTAVQCKRNLALARRMGLAVRSADYWEQIRPPLPTRYLLFYAKYFSPLLLAYNTRRLQRSRPPHLGYALFQLATRVGGPGFVKLCSRIWTRFYQPR